MSADLLLVALLLVLIVIPRVLQRFGLPSAITALVLGFGAQLLGVDLPDSALGLLSTLGIVALFLFAGLEISASELRRNARFLIQFGVLWSGFAALTAFGAMWAFELTLRAALLVALGLMTPSAGFILSSLGASGMSADERFAVKTKVIAAELLALATLFIVVQSSSAQQLGMAAVALAALLVVIPLAFRFFARFVAPYAPKLEFAFLLGVAVVTAIATRALGVYYLLGAFLVGVSAQRFRSHLPALSSEKLVDALEAFGSVFIPFYFFVAGTHIERAYLSWWGIALGLALIAVFVPLRIGLFTLHRRLALEEPGFASRRVATALIPTLVFTLVISDLLRSRFAAPDFVFGGLIIYTVLNTLVPALFMGAPPPEFDSVEAPDPDQALQETPSPT